MVYNIVKEDFPIYSVFLLILLISGGFLTDIFPHRLRNVINNNLQLKHLFAFMILLFFIVLSDTGNTTNSDNFFQLFYKSILLYIFFILLIKIEPRFFVAIIILLIITYIITIRLTNIEKAQTQNTMIEYNILSIVSNVLFVCIISLLVIGLLSYLRNKHISR
jgi:small-conductance mechanosensitive channel